MTKASARSRSMVRQSGATTSSTWRWVSMPGGPSASVMQSMTGPPSKRNPSRARAMSSVTVTLLLGLMTRMRALTAPCPRGGTVPVVSTIRP